MAPVTTTPSVSRAHKSVTNRVAIRAGSNDNQGRQSWDAFRFFQTVTFFNNPLSVATGVASTVAKAVTAPLRGSIADEGTEVPYTTLIGVLSSKKTPAVLVTGATGGVGTRVVRELLAKGKRVRALVRDLPKAKKMLGQMPAAPGGVLEVVAADLTQPGTMRAEMFDNVRAVVSCAGCVVRPKEADDQEDRTQKYMQGIKFFEPTLMRDTPDAVERDGMQYILNQVAAQLGQQQGVPLLDPSSPDFVQQWHALDDVVMGGVSESGIFRNPRGGPAGQDVATFRGNVSVANNGGFASVRPRNWDPALDLGGYEGLRVTLRGDGQRYKFILRCSDEWDSVAYCLSVDTPEGEWATLDLPFEDFKPVFRARTDRNATPLDPSNIHSLQIMLSKFEYDGDLNPNFKPGAFELPISAIDAYIAHSSPPRFVHVSSAGVTRCDRPGIVVDEEPPAVRMNDMLGGLLTYKLAGEDVVRASGVPYAIVRPCALTEEPSGMPVEFDQGDTVRGKIGRDDLASLCVHLLESSAGTNRTFEVKSTVPFSEPWTDEQSVASGERNWENDLQSADLKSGVTGKTINGVYTGREPESKAAGAGAAAAAESKAYATSS